MIKIIPFVLLWLGLWMFGYYCIQTRNMLLGGTMIMMTVPIDVYFAYQFQEVFILGSGFLGIAFSVMAAWTFGVFLLINRSTNRSTTRM